jgi:AcrR family transcriptional regulator
MRSLNATGSRRRVARGKVAGAERLGTRDRIIVASIDLFNQQGIQHVPVEQIAASMSISPGNLTYHFRRKRDLVRAAFDVLQARLRTVLKPRLPAQSPQEGGEYLVNILRTFWEFRFFFNALTFLLSQDRVLRDEYFRFQEWALRTLEDGLQELMNKGQFRPIRFPNNARLLAENIWGQWLNWLRMQQLQSPTAPMPEGHALYESALHHWSLLEPYLTEEFADGLLPVYRKLLLDGSKDSRRQPRGGPAVPAGRPRHRAAQKSITTDCPS